MERRDFLRNSLLFTLGFRMREWPFRVYSFPSKVARPSYTTWWHAIATVDFQGKTIALKWQGLWDNRVKDVALPRLPELTDLQFQAMQAMRGKEGRVITQDDLKKILVLGI